jgi:DtxR family Mn-dependent transcriptional regulator
MPEVPTNMPDAHSPAVEDYIKHIFKLTEQGEKATTKALAGRLGLGQGTVSGMLRQLAGRGLVEHQPYRGVQLTDAGRRLATQIIRRHRLIELFLVRTLDLGWDEVDRYADRLEHAVSDELVERIDERLGRPDIDPHGAPIPDAEGQIELQHFVALADLSPGQVGLVRRVSDREPGFLQYLQEQGIGLDSLLEVIAIDPFGSMAVRVEDRTAHLAREASLRIFVSLRA